MNFDIVTMMRGTILMAMFFIVSSVIIVLVKNPTILIVFGSIFAVIDVLGNVWNYFDPPER